MDNKPNINVTPLIDVLLVLLIIFMVVSPIKPTDFKTKIPQEPTQDGAESNIDMLVVAINSNSTLRLNIESDMGTVREPAKLIEKLQNVFRERTKNRAYADGREFRNDLPVAERIEKTDFIKAPRFD